MIKYEFENGDKVPKIARTQAPEHYTFKDMNEIKDFINTKTDGQLVQGDLDATTPVYVAPHWKDKNDLDAWIVKDTEITLVTTAHGTISGTIATNEATRLVIHGYHKISLTEMKVGIVTIEFDATGVITKIDDPDASSNWPIKPLNKYPLQSDMFPLLEDNKAYSFLDSDDKFVIGTVVEKTATEATICGERYFKDRGECVRYVISSTGTTAPAYALRTQFVKDGVQAFESINKQQLDALETSLKAYVGSEGNKKQNNLTTAQLAVINSNPFLATLQTKYDGYQALITTNTSGVAKNLASINVNIADIKTNKDNITSLQGRSRNRGRFDTLAAANAFFTPLAGTENKLNDQDMVLIGAITAVNFTEYFWEETFATKPAPDLKWRLGGSVIQGSSTFGDGTDVHLQTGVAYSKKEADAKETALEAKIKAEQKVIDDAQDKAAADEKTRVDAELAKKPNISQSSIGISDSNSRSLSVMNIIRINTSTNKMAVYERRIIKRKWGGLAVTANAWSINNHVVSIPTSEIIISETFSMSNFNYTSSTNIAIRNVTEGRWEGGWGSHAPITFNRMESGGNYVYYASNSQTDWDKHSTELSVVTEKWTHKYDLNEVPNAQ